MYTMNWNLLYNSKPYAMEGMTIQGDFWNTFYPLVESSDFDKSYFGADVLRYKLDDGIYESIACKIEYTGRVIYCENDTQKIRIKITVCGDGYPDENFNGWMWISSPHYRKLWSDIFDK